mgnify:CR=1 FL=1
MESHEIEKLIDHKIRRHEIRVGWISGILGIVILSGLAHAIRLCYLAATL